MGGGGAAATISEIFLYKESGKCIFFYKESTSEKNCFVFEGVYVRENWLV